MTARPADVFRASLWLRALALVMAVFTTGHTLATAAPRNTRGPAEALVFTAMQTFRFHVMGFDRTVWDFYRGFALIITVLLAFMAVVSWQLAAISRTDPRQALPMAITLLIACLLLLVLSVTFFFAAPIVMAALATACASGAVVMLVRDTHEESVVGSR